MFRIKTCFIFLTVAVAASSVQLLPAQVRVGEKESVNYRPAASEGRGLVEEKVFEYPGASYVAIHFKNFHLADGDHVTVSDPEGQHIHRYEGDGKVVRNGEETLSDF